jgi:hypothetical protein
VGGKPWTLEEDKLLIDNYNSIMSEELLSIFPDRSYSSVNHRATRLKLTNPNNRICQWIPYNVNFFDEPNLLNCYWGGFLAADGCVSSTSDKISISLHQKDSLHLDRFCKDVSSTKKARFYEHFDKRHKKIYYGCSIQFGLVSNGWAPMLKKHFNIVPNKTNLLLPPNITDQYLCLAYIVGLLDGDGSVHLISDRYDSAQISMNGTYEVCDWVKDWFEKIVPPHRIAKVNKNKSIYKHNVKGKRAIEIIRALRDIEVPKLSRKWEQSWLLSML